ncbi:MAG: 4Fe-4S dicluster domain-containing protein [Coriobacteriales bacterium]
MKSSNEALALLIDTEFCTGCHTCEVACKKEHNLPTGVYGIQIMQMGPFRIADDNYEYKYAPIPGKLCDLCAERRGMGKTPLCVQSCQAKVMSFGTVAELAEKAAQKPNNMLYVIE